MNLLTQLHSGRLDASDKNVAKIARFLGTEFRISALDTADINLESGQSRAACDCFMASADTLVRVLRSEDKGASGLASLAGRARLFLVYGFRPELGHGELLQQITGGAVTGLEPAKAGAKYEVPGGTREWTGQFAGLEFGSVDPAIDAVFVSGASDLTGILVRAGGQPLVVLVQWRGCQWLLAGAQAVADLDSVVRPGDSVLGLFSSLVPVMMFLRRALGDHLWHTPQPRACFVLDDPPLWPRYGFFRYDALLRTMKQSGFSTSIAFIPWNYRRSQRGVADSFVRNADHYSLCVHGCDHTAGEFGGTDLEMLRQRCQTALDRMERHRHLSGVGFDAVMVFPQGLFSSTAMRALRSTGFLAAVNSTPFAVDDPAAGLPLSELLDVAVLRYDNLPLFLRRYPRSVADVAFDLFVGKPALIVEHHGYFRNGCGPLCEFVERLNAVEERLQWTSLGAICSRVCQQRRRPGGGSQVRFYTDRFEFRHVGAEAEHYELSRSFSPEEPLVGVRINGQPADYQRDHHGLRLELTLAPGQTVQVRVERESPPRVPVSFDRDAIANGRVMLRRMLCEFRDNYVERSVLLTRAMGKARRLVRFHRG